MRLLLAVLFCSVMLPSAYAEKLPAPTGKPVLTISGKIGNMNVGDKAVFDLAMLEKLGMKTIETTTPWYTGKVRFDGIPLNKLMDLVGAKGTSARVLALNDYTTIIPIDDFMSHVWGWESDVDVSVIWVHISNIRKKLVSMKANVEIRFIRGAGYKLEEANDL